ncbi:MAG: thermonuclease family protein [Mobilicoccus sp.]|nr:thermonuclease family protein [Mobilicoccus sp.]
MTRPRPTSPWAGFGTAVVMGFVIVLGAWLALREPPAPPADATPPPSTAAPFTPGPRTVVATVHRVADGDTLEINLPGEPDPTRARLLGMDSPEGAFRDRAAQCLADEATEALRRLAPQGSSVHVDVMGTDRFGRSLVALSTTDGLLINAELVRLGLAAPMVVGGDMRLQGRIRDAQAEASASGYGLHAAAGCTIPGRLVDADRAAAQAVLNDLTANERNPLVQGLTAQAREAAEREARRLIAG